MEVSNIYITTFIQSLEVHREKLAESLLTTSGSKELSDMLELSLDAAKNIGHTAFQDLIDSQVKETEPSTADNKKNLSNYFVCFDWVEAAKSFKLLLRDVLIQHQKSDLLFRLGNVEEAQLIAQKKSSLVVIDKAISFLSKYYSQGVKKLISDESKISDHVLQYDLQNNPWPIYHGQIKLIEKQVEEILSSNNRLNKVAIIFQEIEESIANTPRVCEKEFNQFMEKAKMASSYVENNIDEKPRAVASFLEDLDGEIKLQDHLNVFNESLRERLEKIGDALTFPVGSREGIVLQNEIDFKGKIKDWLDTEILPLMYELWEYTENLEGNLKMALINVQNRASILSKGDKESKVIQGEREVATQPLENYILRAKDWISKIDLLSNQMDVRMAKDFNFKNVYKNPDKFLPISIQSTIGNLDLGQNEVVTFLSTQYQRGKNFISRIKKDVEREEKLSFSEKVVRAINSQETKVEYGQYASIFLTKGYIGESFWIGREKHLAHFEESLAAWKNGFRGNTLVTGRRLSGKSLFGEKIANQHFPKNTIRVTPNSLIRVKGRKFITTYELAPALEFIRQHSDDTQSLVWIDDLELWASQEILLGKNTRALIDFIDNTPKHLFFMVAMSNWLKVHLNTVYKLNSAFQAEINLDKMNQKEIAKAILIRHGATHKTLVDKEGDEISAQAFQKRISKINKQAKSNIGDALNLWISSVEDVEEDKIGLKPLQNYSLPDFLTPDSAVLLSTMMLQKVTSDYRLRRIFGSPFDKNYRKNLQRLLKLKIVIRNLDGSLVINEVIANELEQLLERKKYLFSN